MKSIIYILIVIFFSSIIISAIPKSGLYKKQVVKIQCTENSFTPGLLDKSSVIIQNRLKDYGLQNFELFENKNQKSIEISFSKEEDLNEIMPLLISNGEVGFYETYNRNDVIKLLGKEDSLFSMLNIPADSSSNKFSPAVLGYCKPEDIMKVNTYITKHYVGKSGDGIKYLWSYHPDKNGDYNLFLVKNDAALNRTQVIKAVEHKYNGKYNLKIDFSKQGALIWQNLSRINMGKSIVFAFDNLVYAAPIVNQEIKGGKCEISGDFSLNEVLLLKSLIINEELPLNFKLVN